MDVGKRITFLREAKGYTVNKLAVVSGVSQSYLRDIELGNKQPTVEYLGYICYGLGISLKDFFDEDENKYNELTSAINNLSCEQRKCLTAFIESMQK